MAYELIADNDGWRHLHRAILINGAPLRGKTSSLMTFPGKRAIVIAPGELGYSSIRPDESTLIFYDKLDPKQQTNWIALVSGFEKTLDDLIAGKHGELQTLAVDGLHKLFYAIQLSQGYTLDTDPREFAKYHERFTRIVTKLISAQIPYRVATVYDGMEVIDPIKDKKESAIYPDLPGKMAKHVMGMFPLVLHAFTFGEGTAKQFLWRTNSNDSIRGAGLHLPQSIVAKIPQTIKQDWSLLEKAIEEAAK